LTTNTKPRAGTPEYDEAMLEAHDNSVQPDAEDELANAELESLNEQDESQTTESEAELPEGVSMDDLLAAYKAQQEQSQTTESDKEESSEDAEEEGEEESEESNEDDAEDNPLETRVKQLEEQLVTEKIYAAAGGKEQYEQLREQAEGLLDEAQVELMNTALMDGTPEQAVAAVKLMQRFTNTQNSSPDAKIQEGSLVNTGKTAGSNYFSSQDEMMDAMRDPRYSRNDSIGHKYRDEVMRRASRI
jgi:hypothetical protein